MPSDLAEIIAQAVARAVEPLRKEIELLRLENAEQRLIEHKPDRSAEKLADHQTLIRGQPAMQDGASASLGKSASEPRSFADLLAGLD